MNLQSFSLGGFTLDLTTSTPKSPLLLHVTINRTSALQQLQVKAAQSTLEREKLVRVVNSFGGRSLEELTGESQRMERRLQEAEKALAKSEQVAAVKVAEAMEALEQATNLAQALETERSARTAAEEGRRNATQKLRCCLRSRAKAEHAAREATAAMRKSETQKDSLVQRLEVLRTTNRHLEKKAAAVVASSVSAGTGAKSGGGGGGISGDDTVARLATARARLRTLSAAGGGALVSTSTTFGEGQGQRQGGKERAAIERAMGAATAEKRWRAKLREAETRGEVYQSAAKAAETGLTEAVRQRAELEEINRILTKKLADETSDDVGSLAVNIGRNQNGGDSEVSPVVVDRSSGLHRRVGDEDAASTGLPVQEEDERHACTTQRCSSGVPSCLPERPCKLAAVGNSTEPPVATILGHSSGNYRHIAGLPKEHNTTNGTMLSGGTATIVTTCSGLGETPRQQLPSSTRCRVPHVAGAGIRSDSVDACGISRIPSPVKNSCSDRHLRPRSASATIDLSRCGRGITPPIPRYWQQQQQHHHHQHQGEAVETVDNEAPCCVSSTAPFNQFLSESRQLRDEVLAAVQNGPFRRQGASEIGGSGDTNCGVGSDDAGDGWRGPLLAQASGKAAATSIPIELLLRHCDRGVRGAWCEEREGFSGDAAGGKDGCAKANQTSPTGKAEDGSQESQAESPERNVKLSAAGENTNAALPLPPGVTSTLAQQVRDATLGWAGGRDTLRQGNTTVVVVVKVVRIQGHAPVAPVV